MTCACVVHGDTPLRGEVRVVGAKNLVSKAMVAGLLGRYAEPPLRRAPHPRRRGRARPAGAARRPGQPTGVEPGELVLDPTNVDRANVDEINVHAGSSRIPILLCGPLLHRLGHAFIPDLGGCHIGDRPIDFHLQALREFGAHGRQDATGPGHHRAERLARHQVRPALPERRRDRAGAADRGAGRGCHRAAQRGRRARDHRPDLRPAEDGRRSSRCTPTGSSRSRASPPRRLPPPPDPGPHRGGELGRGRAGHRRRRVGPRRPPARHDDVPQRLPGHRRPLRHRRRPATAASGSGTRARS